MRGKFIVLLWVCISCDNDFFPEGLYDYQVEQLLSGGSTKSWKQVQNFDDCQDSIRLVFTLLSDASDDSVLVQRLVANESCNGFDTVSLGNADASSFSDAILFTDSLNFANGSFWIIQNVTSDNLTIEGDDVTKYIL